jgi:hypothetical protein
LISFRVTSEVLSGGVNPLLCAHIPDAKKQAKDQLYAGLTQITGWMPMKAEDLHETAGTFAPLYKALQHAIRPRHRGLEVTELHSVSRSQRSRRMVMRQGFQTTSQQLSSSFHPPPHKRGRHKSASSSPAQPQASPALV